MKAVDLSVYQGHVSRDTWGKIRADGYELAIIGTWHGNRGNPYAVANFDRAKAEGFEHLATYAVVTPGINGRDSIRNAKRFAGAHWDDMRFVSVDVELPDVTVNQVIDAVAEVKRMGLKPCIYTAYWFWHDVFGNPTGLNNIPLWNAFYDSDEDIDYASLPYGGWSPSMVIGEQYQGTTPLHGTEVDLNTFAASFVIPKETYVVKKGILVWNNGYTFAENMGHHWYIGSAEMVQSYKNRGWPIVARKPEGSRIDV